VEPIFKFRYKCILRLLIYIKFLRNTLAINPINKNLQNLSSMREAKNWNIWNTNQISRTIINNIINKVQTYLCKLIYVIEIHS